MRFPACLFLLAALCGCGPKEIGEGTSYEPDNRPEAVASDLMRLPMTGMNNTQKMLYWHNRPDIMESVQRSRMGRYRRAMGLEPGPEDPDYRSVPKQRSPFRQ